MELFDILVRAKHLEFWDLYEKIVVEEMPGEVEKATFVAYERFKEKYRHDLTYGEFWGYMGQEVEEPTACRVCGDTQINVIYMGFGFQLCTRSACRTATGFFSWVPLIYFDGWIFPYLGSYLTGLWDWLTFNNDDD